MNAAVVLLALAAFQTGPKAATVRRSEFIFTAAPFASCHASTVVETDDGLAAAWFGGSREGAEDVGIWMSRFDGRTWSFPQKVADGEGGGGEGRFPCWNPVLFKRRGGEVLLFYKVGPSPSGWWGMVKASHDGGRTWSAPHKLAEGIIGPVKNKPLELADGTLLCGSSTEAGGWRVHLEWTKDPFGNWRRGSDLNEPPTWEAIQPAILRHKDGRLQILCRSKQGVLLTAWSNSGDPASWTELQATELANPDSGVDAVTLADGRHLLVYNPVKSGRDILAAALSADGRAWKLVCVLEKERGSEFSYPAVIQTQDGRIHITYTWKRKRIKHVVLELEGAA